MSFRKVRLTRAGDLMCRFSCPSPGFNVMSQSSQIEIEPISPFGDCWSAQVDEMGWSEVVSQRGAPSQVPFFVLACENGSDASK